MRARLQRVPLAAWVLLAVAGYGLLGYALHPDRLALSLGDSDDATRLLQVRQLLSGGNWFDPILSGLGGDAPLVSHWSRLVDAPLAAMMALLELVVAPEAAELGARAVWPLALLVVLVWIIADTARAGAGRGAGLLAIAFALTAMPGLVQFAPGRIDHHNAQILGAVGGALLLARAFRDQRLGWAAGILLGLSIAIGYEGLLLVGWALGVSGLAALWLARGLEGVWRAGLALAATVWVCLLATVPVSRWGSVHCDALSLNVALLATGGALGLMLAARLGRGRAVLRVGVAGAAALAGLAAFAAAEPACLAGPFAQSDPRIWPIWLSGVGEAQGIVWLAGRNPVAVLAWLLFLAAGLGASLVVLRREADETSHLLIAFAAFATIFSLWQVKLMPYASFLFVPLLAQAVIQLRGGKMVSRSTARLAVAGMSNQLVLALVASSLVAAHGAVTGSTAAHVAGAGKRACITTPSIAPLAGLPAGLFVADIDLGPFIAALTPHRALAGPYHRIGPQIVANHGVLQARPEEAQRLLSGLGASYLALCAAATGTNVSSGTIPDAVDGLRQRLLEGARFAFLEPVRLEGQGPVRVWRVVAGTSRPLED